MTSGSGRDVDIVRLDEWNASEIAFRMQLGHDGEAPPGRCEIWVRVLHASNLRIDVGDIFEKPSV